MKKEYILCLDGCDDYTEFEIALTKREFSLLQHISEISKEVSDCVCKPRLEIQEKLIVKEK